MGGPYAKVVMDEESFRAGVERAKQYTYRRTRPLCASSPGNQEHFASCVLVRAGLSTFAVTAAHAVDEITRSGAVPAIGALGDVPASIPFLASGYAEIVAPAGDRTRDRVDVAAIRLQGGDAQLGVGHELVELAARYEPDPGDVVVVHGFPVERGSETERNGVPAFQTESAFFYSAPIPLPRKIRPKDGSRGPTFALRYDRNPPARVGMTGRAPHPRGLSGSGAWLLGRKEPRTGQLVLLERVRLVGIVQAWRPREGAMVVTRAAEVGPCVYLCPGAREAALQAFPELSAMRPIDNPSQ